MKGNRRRIARAVMLLLLVAGAGMAHAGGCTIGSTGVAFGLYQPLTFASRLTSTDVTSTGSVEVRCMGIATGGRYSAALGPSTTGPGDRISVRYLVNSTRDSDPMAYNLYLDPTYATIWGGGGVGSEFSGTVPTGDSSQSFTFYGRVPGGQNTLRAGTFTDTLTMTLTYNP